MRRFFQRRRTRKAVEEALRHARHLLNMRGDIMPAGDAGRLTAAVAAVEKAVRADGGGGESRRAVDELYPVLHALTPKRAFPGLRENVEVIAVAIAVAMGFRSYFLQPFKIPTGSMEPTLYGIHSRDDGDPKWTDRFPAKYVKWLVTGEMHHVVRVRPGGHLGHSEDCGPNDPVHRRFRIGPHAYRVPHKALDPLTGGIVSTGFKPGDLVPAGAVLWAGTVTAGDHVFVNKVLWNVRRPRRGEVMVFATSGIADLQQNTHYIKRLVALPRESVSIRPPDLLIDGDEMRTPAGIRRVASQAPGYAGYTLAPGAAYLGNAGDVFTLGDGEFFALGDNTRNSRDGRYWGAVPAANLVGPATTIYWPLTRWRFIE